LADRQLSFALRANSQVDRRYSSRVRLQFSFAL
jgi:hypothetical protein